jgi:hypothetical protein
MFNKSQENQNKNKDSNEIFEKSKECPVKSCINPYIQDEVVPKTISTSIFALLFFKLLNPLL